ncbi:MAG TPA: hypothetical protein PKI19_04820, partial [Elusimicrobiales bacterium]|nr:hypothetical protein [Elusimicrobiales bacterium]
LWAARRRGLLPDFLLPVYFVLIHSLFSVESRYLQPMACLAAPLAAAVLFPRPPDGDAGGGAFHAKAVRALFLLSFCAVLAVEALIIAYPLRAGGAFSPGSLQRALGQFPDDRVLQELRCDEHLAAGDYAGYYVCLDGYSRKFGDAAAGYFLRVRVSGRPAALPLPGGRDAQSYSIVRMLREFQLGDSRAALVSFGQAYALYEAENDTGRGAPYEKDKEIERVIKQDSNSFWDRYVYEALLKWPPGEIARILSEVEKHKGLTARLGLLKYAAGGPCNSGGLVSCLSGSDGIFEALVSESLLRRAAGLALLPARAGESRPAAAAYFRALSARSPKVPEYLLFGNGIAEAELYKMLELRGARQPGPAADRVREALRLRKRPVYYALAALYAPDNGGAELRASLDGLERELAADLPMLRSLYAAESAAGNAAPARRLALLAERLSAPEEKKKKEGIEKSRRLADAAVEKMRSGAYGAARQLLAEALLQNPENPEALMTSCSLFVLQGKKEKALEACRNVTAAVRSSPALGTPAFEVLAGDAAWTSYKLLKELGRAAEAREVLRLAVEKAPAAWPGLAQARLALEADARAALKAAKE